MKFWKYTFITVFAFLGIGMTVLYSSCVQDSCTDLKCQHDGTCSEGFCKCPTGYTGAECEKKITDDFTGTYLGTTECNQFPHDMLSNIFDTVDIFVKEEPLTVGIVRRRHDPKRDTVYGVIDGTHINVPTYVKDSFTKNVNFVVDSHGLTYHEYEVWSIDTITYRNNCTFNGTRAW